MDIDKTDLYRRRPVRTAADRLARAGVRALRWLAERLFAGRYGPGAVVLETVSAVPGMVGATLLHLKCLRRLQDDGGWIRALLNEADSQRTHLMVWVEIARPGTFERLLILLAQGLFYNAYFLLYLLSPGTAHRLVGYFEEEAVASYTHYLAEIAAGRQPDGPAPALAIEYWNLPAAARLSRVVEILRDEEAIFRDINHGLADRLAAGEDLAKPVERPRPASAGS
jgi:ubiquinol oxidase